VFDDMPMQQPTGNTVGADATTENVSVCSCGAGRHPTHAGICEKGHAMRGNQLHRVHGLYSFRDRGDRAIPADLRTSADEMLAGIVADKGGAENLTTLKREYAQQVRTLRVMLDLIGNHLVQNGLTTPKGRIRSAVSKYLEVFDRFDKAAQRLGVERESKQVPSLREYLATGGSPCAERDMTSTAASAGSAGCREEARNGVVGLAEIDAAR
jgi:hypothetical protein